MQIALWCGKTWVCVWGRLPPGQGHHLLALGCYTEGELTGHEGAISHQEPVQNIGKHLLILPAGYKAEDSKWPGWVLSVRNSLALVRDYSCVVSALLLTSLVLKAVEQPL